LYGFAQSQPMPVGSFEWVSEEEYKDINWKSINTEEEVGYILEVTLDYPKHLHKEHSSYPLAPEKMNITYSDLSDYAKKCHQFFYHNENYNANKLVSTLGPKRNYVVHFANLKFYLEMGLTITKIFKVLKFKQSTFLKKYIDYCTMKRQNSNSNFQRNIWKLCANACYGKFIEQVRNRLNCLLVNKDEVLVRKITKNNFSNFKIFNENLIAVFSKKQRIKLDKAYSIGFSVLEYSKLFMYKSFYLHIKPYFKTCSILFTDTDSFCFVVTKFNQDKHRNALDLLNHIMDYSNFDSQHPKYNDTRKNKLGFFKSEVQDKKILEFSGIRSKTYSIKVENNKVIKRSKGIAKGYRNNIAYKDYKKCLKHIVQHNVLQYNIRSKNHNLQTLQVRKLAFSSFDDKRVLLNCAVHSIPYFSSLVKKSNYFCSICQK
jgi:hypothetical protein